MLSQLQESVEQRSFSKDDLDKAQEFIQLHNSEFFYVKSNERSVSVLCYEDESPTIIGSILTAYDYENALIYWNDKNVAYISVVLDGLPIYEKKGSIHEMQVSTGSDLDVYLYTLSNVKSEVALISNGCLVASGDDLCFEGLNLKLDLTKYEENQIKEITLDESLLDKSEPIERSEAISSIISGSFASFRKILFVFIAVLCLGFYALEQTEVEELPPPKVVDEWKNYRSLLTQSGVNVRVRMLAIYNDIEVVNKINGFSVTKVVADETITKLTLQRAGGDLQALRQFAEVNNYFFEKKSDEYVLSSVSKKVPIMDEAYRIPISSEESFHSEFIEDLYSDQVKVTFERPVSQGQWIEKTVRHEFEAFTKFDLDTLSIMMNPHPFSFKTLILEKRNDGFYKGTLLSVLIGVKS